MVRFIGCTVLAMVCGVVGVMANPASGADLVREVSLIQRLGKAQAERRKRSAQPPSAAEIASAARTIDQFLQVGYKEHKVAPNPPASDEVFLRRIYLDIVGRIPTIQEAMAFRNDRDANKRAKLIDQLLNSEGYVHHNFSWWADLLRIQSSNQAYYGGQAYANWIKQAIRDNKPYDKIVYELITSEGFPWQNGAAGFYLRDDGMPLDHMSTTIQVFLGTSLQCAQCHDHPFDKWSQLEFYEMAAFTYGVETRRHAPNFRKAMELVKDDDSARRALEQFARALEYGVSEGAKEIKLPHDYKYDDAKPFQPVKPQTIFGGKAEPAQGQSLRQAYAQWIIDRQNPRFTVTIANRMWKKVFGLGLIEPPDQMTDDTKPISPELLDFLSHKMESYNYDLRQFQRMLFNTQAYQRESTGDDLPEGKPYYFPGPLLHRMSAEQFWDSLVTLMVPEVDYRRGEMSDDGYYKRVLAMQNASPEELASAAKEEAGYDKQRRELREKMKEARDAGNEKLASSLRTQLDGLKKPRMMEMLGKMDGSANSKGAPEIGYNAPTKDPKTWEGIPEHLVRASEIRSPANPNHFLRQFGQSDRDTINNANAEPNIIQVLGMFNGPFFTDVIQPWSQLMKNINSVSTPLDKVDVIFLSLLGRRPNASEKALIEQHAFRRGQEPNYGKVVWALLNTREFSFVQ